MRKRIVVTACALLFLWLAFSGKSAAQTTNPCLWIGWEECWPGDNCSPPGIFIIGPGPGGWTLTIGAWTCPPQPCIECSGGSPSATASHPIYLTSGDTYIEETDVALSGLSGGLSLRRRWNSVWPS